MWFGVGFFLCFFSLCRFIRGVLVSGDSSFLYHFSFSRSSLLFFFLLIGELGHFEKFQRRYRLSDVWFLHPVVLLLFLFSIFDSLAYSYWAGAIL